MSDLRQRVPGHSLIEQLLREWDAGNIHVGTKPGEIVVDDEARGWYLGVHGERWVATRLALLGPEYTVLHSVPIGRADSDIDHVVIGPAGVFTINTKYSPGRKIWSAGWGIYVGKRPEPHFIRNMDFEVKRAGAKLAIATGITVEPMGLLVFVDPDEVVRKAPAGSGSRDIRVISDAELIATIGDRRFLTADQVARLAEAAVRPETWHDAPGESTNGTHIAMEFNALEDAVGPLVPGRVARKPRARTATSAPRRSAATRPTAPRPRRGPEPEAVSMRSRVRRIAGLVVGVAAIWWLTRPEVAHGISELFTR